MAETHAAIAADTWATAAQHTGLSAAVYSGMFAHWLILSYLVHPAVRDKRRVSEIDLSHTPGRARQAPGV